MSSEAHPSVNSDNPPHSDATQRAANAWWLKQAEDLLRLGGFVPNGYSFRGDGPVIPAGVL